MAEKVGYLDSLRGIGACIVFLNHYLWAFYPALITGALIESHIGGLELSIRSSPLNWMFNGNFAVCVFFVLSGYVLTLKYFQTRDHKTLVSSATRRYIRLLVPVFVSIITIYAFMKLSLYHNLQAGVINHSNWLESLKGSDPNLINAISEAVWGSFHDGTMDYNNVLWTMMYELSGSFLVYSIASLFGEMKNRWVIYIAGIIFFNNSYYIAFILGMLLCDFYNSNDLKRFEINNTILLTVLLLTGLFFGTYIGSGSFGQPVYDWLGNITGLLKDNIGLYHIIGAFLVLLALLNSNLLKKILSYKVFTFFGKISFSMYVSHMIVIDAVSCGLLILFTPFISYNLANIIIFLITLPILITISYLMYKYVDEWGVRQSKRFYELFFTDKFNGINWVDIRPVLISFAKKNLYTLLIIEVILILTIGGMVFTIKPIIDQNQLENARAQYYEDYNKTATSFENVNNYTPVNNTSIGAYYTWLKGFKNQVSIFIACYDNLKSSGMQYESHSNDSERMLVDNELLKYVSRVNESIAKEKSYEDIYNNWYWIGKYDTNISYV